MILWFVPALLALLVVHLAEPALPLSWSFAGIHAGWGSLLPALLAALAVLGGVVVAWRAPLGQTPVPRVRRATLLLVGLVLWVLLVLAGLRWPAPDVCPDTIYLPYNLNTGRLGNARWMLAQPLLHALYAPFRAHLDADLMLRGTNALFSAASMLLTFGVAARLGRTLREAAAIFLLVWTGFGSLQLAFGYVDIYPLVQLLVAFYVWSALRYLDGDGSIAVPLLTAALGPCFYIGLVLVGPSALPLLVTAWQRGERREILLAMAAGLVLVGLATIPVFGAPFAIAVWLDRLTQVQHGLNPDGQTLPLAYLLSVRHAGEVLSTLVLLDGSALVLVAALPLRARRGLFLGLLLVSGLAFVIVMDPLWGPYSDWDLFSYLTWPLGVAAGFAFVGWSRAQPHLAGVVLGLALATSTVHLFARLNGMHRDYARHVAASPFHLPVPDGVFKPTFRRSLP